MINLVPVFAVAICYFIYNYFMFCYLNSTLDRPPLKWSCHFLTFLLNYTVFVLISLLGTYLIVNWILFALLLLAESAIIYRSNRDVTLYCGLTGAILGLSVNLCTRSAAALIVNLPLTYFDSRAHTANLLDNLKRYPIALGFVISGLIFFLFCRLKKTRQGQWNASFRHNLKFFNRLLFALFIFLALNLIFYSIPANDTILKLWELKNGLCTLTAFLIGLGYVHSLNRLRSFEIQSNAVRNELNSRRLEAKELAELAYTDCLTGCSSREYGLSRISAMLDENTPFYLCFVDVDGLKKVNDTFGHYYGDRYLSAVSHVLKEAVRPGGDLVCRFGGDEFLLLLKEVHLEAVETLMKNMDITFKELTGSSEYPFTLSISYGIAFSQDYPDSAALISTADTRMYAHKTRLGRNRTTD